MRKQNTNGRRASHVWVTRPWFLVSEGLRAGGLTRTEAGDRGARRCQAVPAPSDSNNVSRVPGIEIEKFYFQVHLALQDHDVCGVRPAGFLFCTRSSAVTELPGSASRRYRSKFSCRPSSAKEPSSIWRTRNRNAGRRCIMVGGLSGVAASSCKLLVSQELSQIVQVSGSGASI